MRSMIPLFVLAIAVTGCEKKDDAGGAERGAAKASKPAKTKNKDKGGVTLSLEVAEAVRMAEVAGEKPFKAVPGWELVCVRFTVESSGKTALQRPQLTVASGKQLHYQQHASAGFADDAWPVQGIMDELDGAARKYAMCFQVKEADAAAEMTLELSASDDVKASTTFTASPAP